MTVHPFPTSPNEELPSHESFPIDQNKLTDLLADKTEALRNSNAWSPVKKAWLDLSGPDQLALYRTGSLTVWYLFLKSIPGLATASSMRNFEDFRLKFVGHDIAPAVRWLVHLSLLPAPAGITREMILQDIAADHGNFNFIVDIACDLVKILSPEATGQMEQIKNIAKAVYEIKTDTANKVQNALPQPPSEEDNFSQAS